MKLIIKLISCTSKLTNVKNYQFTCFTFIEKQIYTTIINITS